MYIVYTNEHESLAITQDAEKAVNFAFKLWGMGIVASIRRSK